MRNLPPAVFALVLLLSSCRDNPVDNSRLWYTVNDAAIFSAGRTVKLYRDSTVISEIATASFRDPDSVGLYGGEVTFNGMRMAPATTINRLRGHPDMLWTGILYQIYSGPDSVPLTFGGSQHRFSVTGSTKVPAITDSIRSPASELTMIYPAPTDTVSKSAGFTLRWEASNDPNTQIQLHAYSFTSGDSPQVGSILMAGDRADDGSMTLTPENLNDLPPGTLVLVLTRTTSKAGNFGEDYRYSMSIYSEVTTVGTMAP